CTLGVASAAPQIFVPALPAVAMQESPAPPTARDADLAAVLRAAAKLDADSVDERESAQRALEGMKISPSVLCEAIRSAQTSPEQRERLALLGPRALYNSMRGALGVSFSNFGGEATVGMTQPGFDSVRVLRTGDQILAIDGSRISEYRQVRPLIISRDPGQEIELRVLRSGKIINVRVKLGRFDDLNNGMGRGFDAITVSNCEQAWRIRLMLEQREHALSEITTDLTQGDWARAQERATLAQLQPVTIVSRQIRRNLNNFDGSMEVAQPLAVRAIAPDDRLAGGGEPRGGTLASIGTRLQAGRTSNNMLNEIKAMQQRQLDAIIDQLNIPGLDAASKARLEQNLLNLKSMLNDSRIP
ncbi:MAG: PDZ domain-containing protein, partial [Planctomycetota bacterium]